MEWAQEYFKTSSHGSLQLAILGVLSLLVILLVVKICPDFVHNRRMGVLEVGTEKRYNVLIQAPRKSGSGVIRSGT